MMILLNCDVGEGCEDEKVMPYIHLANIACGGHTGDNKTMQAAVILAKKHQVKIGAHPSYPDQKNFGRSRGNISLNLLATALDEQIQALTQFSPLHHIKPHGALYHDAAQNEDLFKLLLNSAKNCYLLVPSNLPQNLIHLAKKQNVSLLFEAFADRAYLPDGKLMPRHQKGSVYHNPAHIIQQAKTIQAGYISLPDNTSYPVHADTICLHGDNIASVMAASKL